MSDNISAIEVHRKMDHRMGRMVTENFVVKTERKEITSYLRLLYISSHSEPCSTPCPYQVHLSGDDDSGREKGKTTSFVSVALAWREEDEVLLIHCCWRLPDDKKEPWVWLCLCWDELYPIPSRENLTRKDTFSAGMQSFSCSRLL